jgi:AGZA family xanthine/uracil permease-like MFS transporter
MNAIDSFFRISERGSSIRTVSSWAGVTTFITMAYFIFVQPAVLSAGGMDFGAVLAATCISSAIASIMMGLYANHPIALAPAMGENFFFSFVVIVAMGVPWDIALGIIFISGVLFLPSVVFQRARGHHQLHPALLQGGDRRGDRRLHRLHRPGLQRHRG